MAGARYDVQVERDGNSWLVHVPAVERWTAARTLREVEPMARDLIRIMENLTDAEAEALVLDVDVAMPESAAELLAEAKRLADLADTARHQSGAQTRLAAAQLRASGMPLRDIGALLDVSYQRVHQLVVEAAEESWSAEPHYDTASR